MDVQKTANVSNHEPYSGMVKSAPLFGTSMWATATSRLHKQARVRMYPTQLSDCMTLRQIGFLATSPNIVGVCRGVPAVTSASFVRVRLFFGPMLRAPASTPCAPQI